MKKHKLTIKPAIDIDDLHKIVELLEEMGYDVHGDGVWLNGSSCDISFNEKEDK